MAIIIDNITGETIVQDFVITQQTCSYNTLIADLTTITPSDYNRGKVEYFIVYPDTTEKKIAETSKGSSFYYDFCSTAIYTIRQLLTIRQIPNCGGTSPIIYQSDRTETITIVEWIPELNVQGFEDCLIQGNKYELSFITALNSNVCGALTSQLIIDIVEKPSGSLLLGTTITSPSTTETWAATFDKYGSYLVLVTLQNCCTTVSKYITINVCTPFEIKPDCCECGKYTLYNYSETKAIPYKITQLYPIVNTFTTIQGILPANSSQTVAYSKDGVFEIKYTDIDNFEKTRLWYLFCKIDDCMNSLIQSILCSESCKECPGKEGEKNREKLNKIMLLSQLYYKWIDEEMGGKSYDLFPDNKLLDYSNRLRDLYQIDDIYNKILEICDNCVSAGKTNSDCGCGCK
jgi:hypothetical protein